MAGEFPEIRADVQALAENADKNENKIIEDSERTLDEDNIQIAERLFGIFKSKDIEQKQALDQAIRAVAAEYQGLSTADIYRWIQFPNEEERSPDIHRFGRVPEEHPTERNLDQLWQGMSAKERADALKEGLAMVDILQRRNEQLMILVRGVDGLRTMAEKGGNTIAEKLGFWFAGKKGMVDRDSIQRNANLFLDKVPDLQKAIQENPNATIRDILNQAGYSQLADYFLRSGILFEEPRNEADVMKDQLSMIRFLRKMGDYQMARTMAQETLAPRFIEARNKYFKTTPRQVRVGDETPSVDVIDDLYQKSYDRIYYKLAQEIGKYKIKKNPLFDQSKYKERIQEVNEALAYQDYLHHAHEAIGKKILDEGLNKKWSSTEQAIYAEFKDSMGIGTLDMADENWDFVVDEVCINAPLIVASGFVGSFTREMASRAVSASARAFLGAARVERIAQVAGRLGRVAAWGGGLAFESGVFSTTHEALQGRWIGNAPDWASQWAQSAVFLGTFKGAGQLGKKLGESAKGMVEGIRHPAVRKTAQGFLANGTEFGTEVAAMLALGAIANGAHSNSWEEFTKNYEFGQELFRALVTAGALKVSGRAAKATADRLKGSPPKAPEPPPDPSRRLPLRPRKGGPRPQPLESASRGPAPNFKEGLVTATESMRAEFPEMPRRVYLADGYINGVQFRCEWRRMGTAEGYVLKVGLQDPIFLGKNVEHAKDIAGRAKDIAGWGGSPERIYQMLSGFGRPTSGTPTIVPGSAEVGVPRPAAPEPAPLPQFGRERLPFRPRERVSRNPEVVEPASIPLDPGLKEGFLTPVGSRERNYFAKGEINGVKMTCSWHPATRATGRSGYVLEFGDGRSLFLGSNKILAEQFTRRAAILARKGNSYEDIFRLIEVSSRPYRESPGLEDPPPPMRLRDEFDERPGGLAP